MAQGMQYSQDDRERGVAAYVVGGTFAKAELLCGLPADTIRKWRSRDPAWWADTEERIRTEHEHEHRAGLRDIIVTGIEQTRDRVALGDLVADSDGNYTKRKPLSAKDTAWITAVMIDKLRVSLGHPTSIAGKADNSTLSKLDELRKAATVAAKAKGIEDGSIVDISEQGRAASVAVLDKDSELDPIAAYP